MKIRFWFTDHGEVREFERDVRADVLAALAKLGRNDPRIAFLRDRLSDDRISGHVMVWEPVP
jgi:hypothetical protein